MEHFTEKDLVDFGNFLLSEDRNKELIHESNQTGVTHADLENWKLVRSLKEEPLK